MFEGFACIFFLVLYGFFIHAGYSGLKEDYKKKGQLGISGLFAVFALIALFVAPFIFIVVVGFEKIIMALLGSIIVGSFILFLYKMGK